MNVAPIWTDNDYSADLTQPFATSPWYQYVREAARYSGGLSFDLPPNYAFAREPAYLQNVVQQIQWATENGLRTSVIISPYDIDGVANNYDDTFMQATQRLVAYLEAANALPSQFIVENYTSDSTGNFYSASDPNSLNSVAAYLAKITLTPTNSESGLETSGVSTGADLIITDQAPEEMLGKASAVEVFGNATLFGRSSSTLVTATVSLSSVSLAHLSSANGVVGADGSSVRFTGTVAQVSVDLQSVEVVSDNDAVGSADIDVLVKDATSSIQTVTKLNIDTHLPAAPSLELAEDKLVVNVSADTWIVNAQYTISIDGVQAGGIYSTGASHSAGASQNTVLTGSFGSGAHVVTVDFLNDVYGGSSSKDTNLYVNSITFDGQVTFENQQELACAGAVAFAVSALPSTAIDSASSFTTAVSITEGASTTPSVGSIVDSASILITNAPNPVLQGVAEAGAEVTVDASLGSTETVLGTTTALSTGMWSVRSSVVLADGTYQITATQTDAAGTTSAAAAQSLTVDTHTPAAPVLISVPSLTSLTQPVLHGMAEAGALVTVDATLNGTQSILGTTTATSGGIWSLTPSKALSSGTYQLAATQTDAAGTTSAASAAQSLTVDTHTPAAPVLISVPSLTSLTRPVLQGTAEAGALVTVDATLNGTQSILGTTTATSGGIWSLTPSKALSSGTYQLAATQTDAAGTTSAASAAQSLTIDTHTPAAPVLISVPSLTSLTRPVLQGTAEAGALVTVDATLNGTQSILGTTTATSGGIWSLTPSKALSSGTYQLAATQTDAAGTTSAASAAQSLTVDTHTPAAPVLISVPSLTSLTRPVLQGTAEAGALVTVDATLNGTQSILGTTTATSGGIWSLTPSKALSSGTYQLAATQTDAAGTTSAASAAQSLTIDTHTPAAPGLAVAADTLVLGISEDMWIVNAQFTVDVDGIQVGGVYTTNASHNLGQSQTFTLNGSFGSGAHVVSVDFLNDVYGGSAAKDTNLYVNSISLDGVTTSENSKELANAGPVGFSLAPLASQAVDSATGTVVTNLTRPVLQGTAEAGALVTVDATLNGTQSILGTTTATSGGIWSLTPSKALSSGTYQLAATQTDAAGTTSAASAAQSLTVDTHTPAAPVLISVPSLTSLTQPVLQGTAEAGALVTVDATLNGTQSILGTTTATSGGIWSLTPSKALSSGTYQLAATQTDAAGTTSAASAAQSLTIDTHTPAAPGLAVAADTLVLGISEDMWIVNAQFTVDVDGIQVGGVYTTNASHNLGQSQTFTLNGSFGSGAHVVSVDFLNDVYGGSAAKDTNLYVNSISLDGVTTSENSKELANAGPVGFSLAPLASQAVDSATGTVVTNLTRPVLQGTAEAGALVTVDATLNGTQSILGTTTATSGGIWSLTPSKALSSGTYQLAATQTDAAGTTSAASAAQSLTVDTHTPAAPVLISVPSLTSLTQPVLQGTAEAGALVTVDATLNGTQSILGTTTATSGGIWSLTPSKALSSGTYQLAATQTDAAGTTSAASAAQSLTIDTHTPAAPGLAVAADTLVLGISEDMWIVNAQFTVDVDGIQVGGVYTTNASHNLGQSQTFTLNGSFGSGAHVVSVDFLNDIYGGSAAKDTNLYVNSISLDGVTTSENSKELANAGPVGFSLAPLASQAVDSATGTVVTNLTRPVLQGTAEAGALVTVDATLNGTQSILGTTTATSGGIWSLTPSKALSSGTYQLAATQTDAAGTTSAASAAQSLTIIPQGSGSLEGTTAIPLVSSTSEKMTFISSSDTISAQNGASITDVGSNNTYVLASSGAVTIAGNTLANGDVFDLRGALSSVGWDGRTTDLGSYISATTSNSGNDLQIATHYSGGATANLLLTLTGQGTSTLSVFEQHAHLA